ncbi:MAG TPA: ATP-binding cassette domain-containing protein, partial [Candidatus Limnocylindrales bacterium]|nr:ATP-binding cassette domain-containing protein [Candidatus Limnocylindrales bacterium]
MTVNLTPPTTTPADTDGHATAPGPEIPAPDSSVPAPSPTAEITAAGPATTPAASGRIEIRNLSAYYGDFRAVRDVTMTIPPHAVTAIIGPSGCGKSTFLRSLNRMHELTTGAHIEGELLLDGMNLYDPAVDPVQLRRVIGMVFQRPNPFPTMSIYDNVVAGLRLTGRLPKSALDETVERCLRSAALWGEVK